MKRNRLWVEIAVLATAAACAVALLIATLGAAAGAAARDPEPPLAASALSPSQSGVSLPSPQTYEGMVTCSRCGAKHSPTIARSAADCVRVCVHGGAQFALIDGDKLYILEGDLDQLKKVAGERARISGALSGNTINVSSVASGG